MSDSRNDDWRDNFGFGAVRRKVKMARYHLDALERAYPDKKHPQEPVPVPVQAGFAIFSLAQPDRSGVRTLGQLPPEITLQAVVRSGGKWTRHAEFGRQVRVNTFELVDQLERRGIVAFLVGYATHLGPVRAAEAVERFRDRVFEVLRNSP
jgi:hypothetical protein